MRFKQIVIIGSSDDIEFTNESYRIGKFIAENGWILITGGRGGIMEAVSRGASDAKGIVIGILPGSEFNQANSYCNIVIPTGIGFARNMINVLSADIVIAIGGKSGTLSELAYAWLYAKPVICCTFADGWSSQFPKVEGDDRIGSTLYIASTVEEVFKHLTNFFI